MHAIAINCIAALVFIKGTVLIIIGIIFDDPTYTVIVGIILIYIIFAFFGAGI